MEKSGPQLYTWSSSVKTDDNVPPLQWPLGRFKQRTFQATLRWARFQCEGS